MPPISTIKRLPHDLRAAIEEQLAHGRTLTEVTAHVRGMGADISRSAIGRHKQQLDKILERSRRSREIAEVLARTVGKNGSADLVRGGVELLHGVLVAATETADGGEGAAGKDGEGGSVKNAMMLAIAFEKLSRAAKTGAELERMQADAASQVVDVQARAVPQLPDLSQLTPEQLIDLVRALAAAQTAIQE